MTIDGATIAVTAAPGVLPAGTALRAQPVNDAGIAQAVEAVMGGAGVYTHRQYRVEALYGENNVILPDFEQGVPVVRVEGLNLPADARVAVYDEYAPGAYEIAATVNIDENAIEFDLVDVTVYDIVTVEPLPEREEEPAEELAEGASSYWTIEDYGAYFGKQCDCSESTETYSHIAYNDSQHWLTCGNKKCELYPEEHRFNPDYGACEICDYECPHTWGAWEDAGNGRHKRTCVRCGYTETAKHIFVIGEKQGEDGHQVTCTACNYQETRAHDMKVGDRVNETCHTLACECGYSVTEEHTFELVTADGVYKEKCACGEELSTTHESAWLALQQQIDAASNDTITLSGDVTATEYDGPLVISGKSITLDLAGHTINRGLTAAANDGSVINNDGFLTIRGTGTITGGNTTGHGGGILNLPGSGLVIGDGVTISGNAAAKNGGGIYVSSKAELTMNGGSVSGNTANSGSGLYAAGNGSISMQGGSVTGNSSTYGPGVHPVNGSYFHISGAPVISGNTATKGSNPGAFNLYLRDNTIQVYGALTDDADIHVTTYDLPSDNPVILTQGLSGYGSAAAFTADMSGYKVYDCDGEAALMPYDGKNDISFTVDDSVSEIWAEADGSRVKRVSAGESVTIHIAPAGSNNTVNTLTVKDADGNKINLDANYQFTMPDSAVTITANCIEAYDITIVDVDGIPYTVNSEAFTKDGFTFYRSGANNWKAEVGSTVELIWDHDVAQTLKSLSYTEDGATHSVFNLVEISFVMPAHDVTLTAELETKTAHTITYDPSGFEGYMSILKANNGEWDLIDGPMSKNTDDYVYLSDAKWNQSGSYALLGIEWYLPDGTVFNYSEAHGNGKDFTFNDAINMPNCDVTLRPRVASAYKVYDLTDTLPNIVIASVTGNRINVKAGDMVSFEFPYANQSSLGDVEFVFTGNVRFYRNKAMTDEITGDDLAALQYTWDPESETQAGSFIMPAHDVYLVGVFLAINNYVLAPVEHGTATLSVDGTTSNETLQATQDKAITLTMVPEEGYSVKSVEVTGKASYYVTVEQSVTDPNTYTLTPSTASTIGWFTVTVTFGKPHTINAVAYRGVTPKVMIDAHSYTVLYAGDRAYVTYGEGDVYCYGVEMSYTDPETNETVTELYGAGDYFTMPDADITLTPKCYDWTWLQAQIDAAADGATVKLPDDIPASQMTITASADDAGLVIPANKNITLDLNGWTLNRSLGTAKADGYVIKVAESANLTVTGGGVIVGGYNSGNGGGIKVERMGALCLKNVEISGNKAALGGGVYVDEEAALQVQDNPIVHDNQDTSGKNSNVYLPSADDNIVVLDTLVGEGAYPTDIGVTLNSADNNGIFTFGLSGKGSADMFFSDVDGHAVRENAEGEAELYTATALYNVPYIDMHYSVGAREQTAPVAYSIGSLNEYKLTDGNFYVVDQNFTIKKPIVVSGEARLILMDGCTLTAKAGIIVTQGNTLTIYPQENGTGGINATGKQSAGIGGGMWAGRTPHISKCGTIVIHGGHITAKGDQGAAGIGGGCWATMWVAINQRDAYEEGYSHGGDVTIYGGTVKAYGSMWWDGNYYSNVKHYSIGAGIGGGPMGNGGSLTVYGGSVTAECTGFSYKSQYSSISGIGSGQDFQPDDGWYLSNRIWNERGADVKIYGGTVTATSHANAHPIGSSVATVLNERVGGNTNPGSLTLYSSAKVTVTHNGTTETAAAEDRVDACRTAGSADKNDTVTVTIESCSPHSLTTYTYTATTHTAHCTYCIAANGVEEPHSFENDPNICSVCGFNMMDAYKVMFDSDGGSEVDTQAVAKGGRPLSPETPPMELSALWAGIR